MYHSTSAIPSAEDIHARCHGGPQGRTRVIDMGGVTLHVIDQAALDALRTALAAIEADMLNSAASLIACHFCHRRPAESNVSLNGAIVGVCGDCWGRADDERREWAPGELQEAYGR
jgi:hypothetical protein